MKRRNIIKYLEEQGCEFLREGGKHTVYVNRKEMKVTTIPRHREIDKRLFYKICKDLGIQKP